MLDKDFAFQPRPPPDVVIHISISNCKLRTCVFLLEITNNRPANVQRANSMKGYS